MRICLIAAVGLTGQLGLDGRMPWTEPNDLHWFREVTENGLVIVGYKTYPSIKHIDGTRGRKLILDEPHLTPHVVRKMATDCGSSGVFIAGGAKTYTRWMPYVERFYISRIPYAGPADTWMPDIRWGSTN